MECAGERSHIKVNPEPGSSMDTWASRRASIARIHLSCVFLDVCSHLAGNIRERYMCTT